MQDFYTFVGEFVVIIGVVLAICWCAFKSVEAMYVLWSTAREYENDLAIGLEPKRAAAMIASMTPEQQRAIYRKLEKSGY